MAPPEDVLSYGEAVAQRLQAAVGDAFVGCYFAGSVALGGYVPGQSDIDIVGVASRGLELDEKRRIVRDLTHPHLRCPARGLELVLYEEAAVRVAQPTAAFDLNLNTGPGMDELVELDATGAPRFWFVLDRVVVHEHGIAIAGPPSGALFDEIPRRWELEALAESLAWHRAHEQLGHHAVLNACRAWRCAEEGVLGSKLDGAAWAEHRWPTPRTIRAALARRAGQAADLAAQDVDPLLDHVAAALAEALARTA